jgi:hypothetical protein
LENKLRINKSKKAVNSSAITTEVFIVWFSSALKFHQNTSINLKKDDLIGTTYKEWKDRDYFRFELYIRF